MMTEKVSGSLFIVAAPSGGGKTSLVRKLVESLEDIVVSISHTTRKKRPNEVDGVDYFFVDNSTFMQMVDEGAFLEHAHVFNHYYGTSKAQITERLSKGIDVVLDIDWQGAEQIRHAFSNSVSIFIVPPSLDALNQRLTNRQQDEDAVIADRMQRAHDELSHYPEFDYLIVNDSFVKAADDLRAIVMAHRLRIDQQVERQGRLLSFLLSS